MDAARVTAEDIAEIARLKDIIDRETAKLDKLKAKVRDGLEPGAYETPGFILNVTQTTKIDDAAFRRDFVEIKFPAAYKSAIDTAIARRIIANSGLPAEDYLKLNAPSISVKRVADSTIE